MLLSWIWLGMMGASLLYGCLTGRAGALLSAALDGASSAVSLSLRLMAGYLFFCGLMEIMKELCLPEKLARLLRPFLRLVMPTLRGEEARQAVTLNLTANLLGLGNAATPAGLAAVRRMAELAPGKNASPGLCRFMLLNASSLQLVPTTVLSLRAAAGAVRPDDILLPALVGSAASFLCAVLLGKTFCREERQ